MAEISTVIVGSKFKGTFAIAALGELRPGEAVRLVREDNKFDTWAVACYVGARHVGFLPRQVNAPIAKAMDAGQAATAETLTPARVSGGRVIEEAKILVRVAP